MHLRLIITTSILHFVICQTSKFDYEPVVAKTSKLPGSTSQTALAECHLQVECTAPQSSHSMLNASETPGMVRKIRIPVRAARGPQGPRGLRGPVGPRGPPGFSSEISDDTVASEFYFLLSNFSNYGMIF